MSAQRYISIKCDVPGCLEAVMTPEPDTTQARKWAAAQGWQVRKQDNSGRDVCAKHVDQAKPRKPAKRDEPDALEREVEAYGKRCGGS